MVSFADVHAVYKVFQTGIPERLPIKSHYLETAPRAGLHRRIRIKRAGFLIARVLLRDWSITAGCGVRNVRIGLVVLAAGEFVKLMSLKKNHRIAGSQKCSVPSRLYFSHSLNCGYVAA